MKIFTSREVREAIEYASSGGQALHLHSIIANRATAPGVFRDAVARGEQIAHLFDRDADRLRETVRSLGVRRVKIERAGTDKQHHDLCAGPLKKALERANSQ